MLCCRKVEDTQKDARKVAKVNSFPFLPMPLKNRTLVQSAHPIFPGIQPRRGARKYSSNEEMNSPWVLSFLFNHTPSIAHIGNCLMSTNVD